MTIVVRKIKNEEQKIYSDFIAAHESGSFLQSWGWGEYQTTLGKTAIRYGVFEDNNLIAAAQLLLTKIPTLPGSYLYCAYGPLIKAGYNQNSITEITHSLVKHIKADYAKIWFIRFEPKDNLPIDGKPTLHIQPGSSLITDLASSEDDLLNAMHPKTRYNIKVANKHGITVNSNFLPQIEAINLLTETSKRQGYNAHSNTYYTAVLKYFSEHATDCKASLYTALYGKEIIASAIMIDNGITRTYLFGGSNNNFRNMMAPYALHWQAIKDAKQLGLTKYDWWGTQTASGGTPGFVQFKLRWGGTQKFFAEPRDIVLNSLWYRAYNMLRKINRSF